MKRIFLVVSGLMLSAQVMATGTPGLKPTTVNFIQENKLTLPEPIFDNQKTGLNWMVAPGCPADGKPHTVGGLNIGKCSGNKLADVTTYTDMVAGANFYYCLNNPNDSLCQ